MEMEPQQESHGGLAEDGVESSKSSTSATSSNTTSTSTTPNSPAYENSAPKPVEEPTFHNFPKLALEIRRMIWKASFPRRRGVCLATPLTLHNKGAQRQYPIALHINRESRQTVLEHYIILSHYIKERLLWNTLSVLPLCFDPVRDSLYVRIRPMFYSELKDVAQILLEKAPGHFNKITKLEIHIAPHKGCLWSWSSWFHGILAMHNGRDMMVGMLKFFQKLEFVQLVVPLEFQDLLYRSALRYFPWDSVWEKEKYRVQVLEFFEALKRDNPAYKIPKIEL